MTSTDLIPPPSSVVSCFLSVRPRLLGVACGVLGNPADADDVVQDAWLRWQRTDRSQVRDAEAFLISTTSRLALNVVGSARVRHEARGGRWPIARASADVDPAVDAERTEAVEHAVSVLLERLSPTERAVYVLREAFEYPYRQISDLLALSEDNARQLCLRARRRLSRGRHRTVREDERRRFVDAFAAAARGGDVARLERLLVADLVAAA